jgi:ribosomal protein L40E
MATKYPKCHAENPFDSGFCIKCGRVKYEREHFEA